MVQEIPWPQLYTSQFLELGRPQEHFCTFCPRLFSLAQFVRSSHLIFFSSVMSIASNPCLCSVWVWDSQRLRLFQLVQIKMIEPFSTEGLYLPLGFASSHTENH